MPYLDSIYNWQFAIIYQLDKHLQKLSEMIPKAVPLKNTQHNTKQQILNRSKGNLFIDHLQLVHKKKNQTSKKKSTRKESKHLEEKLQRPTIIHNRSNLSNSSKSLRMNNSRDVQQIDSKNQKVMKKDRLAVKKTEFQDQSSEMIEDGRVSIKIHQCPNKSQQIDRLKQLQKYNTLYRSQIEVLKSENLRYCQQKEDMGRQISTLLEKSKKLSKIQTLQQVLEKSQNQCKELYRQQYSMKRELQLSQVKKSQLQTKIAQLKSDQQRYKKLISNYIVEVSQLKQKITTYQRISLENQMMKLQKQAFTKQHENIMRENSKLKQQIRKYQIVESEYQILKKHFFQTKEDYETKLQHSRNQSQKYRQLLEKANNSAKERLRYYQVTSELLRKQISSFEQLL